MLKIIQTAQLQLVFVGIAQINSNYIGCFSVLQNQETKDRMFLNMTSDVTCDELVTGSGIYEKKQSIFTQKKKEVLHYESTGKRKQRPRIYI